NVRRTLLVKNNGDAPLDISQVSIAGGGFSIVSAPAPTIAPGNASQVVLAMSTASAGGRAATLQILNNDIDESHYDVGLFGSVIATPPEIAIEASMVDIPDGGSYHFGNAVLGDQPVRRQFKIRNLGGSDLAVASIVVTGTAFELVGESEERVVSPGGSYTFEIEMLTHDAGVMAGAVRIANSDPDENPFDLNLSGEILLPDATVLERSIFYGNSMFETSLQEAIDPSKTPLLVGEVATRSNYASYERGINGIIVDIANVLRPLNSSDFEFRIGNNNSPDTWKVAPAPVSIDQMLIDTEKNVTRVALRWADFSLRNTWLQVVVLATSSTGLVVPDVHYWGNAVGDTLNDDSVFAVVNDLDVDRIRANPRNFVNPALVSDQHDINKDRNVNALDVDIVRANPANFLNALRMIDLSAASQEFASQSVRPSSWVSEVDTQLESFDDTIFAWSKIDETKAGLESEDMKTSQPSFLSSGRTTHTRSVDSYFSSTESWESDDHLQTVLDVLTSTTLF
ncbi:MAG: choice-of-anchor D domain-containing protein, partial [Planctomycetota bacterium]